MCGDWVGTVCYYSLYFYMFLYVFGEMIEVECKFIREKYHHHYYQGHADQGVCAAADFVGKGIADSLWLINIVHLYCYLHFNRFAWGGG